MLIAQDGWMGMLAAQTKLTTLHKLRFNGHVCLCGRVMQTLEQRLVPLY